MRRTAQHTVVAAVVSVVVLGSGCAARSNAGTPAAPASLPAATADRLDSALAAATRDTGTPGASAAVIVNGDIAWAGAAGEADIAHHRPMTTDTKIAIASCTKTFTAAMAMLLVEQGKLDLDAPISSDLPYLTHAKQITTRMLLTHSSGLGDYFSDGYVVRTIRRDPTHHWTRREVLSHVNHLQFKPGTRHAYSNTGYVAAGGVLEHASGMGIAPLFDQLIAGPLGLGDSTFAYDPAHSGELATPYSGAHGHPTSKLAPGGIISSDYWGPVWTDGGLASTASDLGRFGNALITGNLVSDSSLAQMEPPRGGFSFGGMGLFEFSRDAHRWIGHDGLYGGFASENWTDPERGVTIAVITNYGHGAFGIWKALASAYDAPAV